MEKLKILVIDDSDSLVATMQKGINSSDIAEVVGTAKDGIDGLCLVEEFGINNIDLIILDISMDRKDGLEFIKDFKKKYDRKFLSHIQVVSGFTSAIIDEFLKMQGISLPPIAKTPKDDIATTNKVKERIKLFYEISRKQITLDVIHEYFYSQGINPIDKNGKYLTEFLHFVTKNRLDPCIQGLKRIEEAVATNNKWTYDAIETGMRKKVKVIEPEMTVSEYISKALNDLGYKLI